MASSKAKKKPGYTRKDIGNLTRSENLTSGRFFVTAAVAATDVHMGFFKAIQNFCKREKAKLIILPMNTHVKALQKQPQYYDFILNDHISSSLLNGRVCKTKPQVLTKYVFNKNLMALDLHLNPQMSLPLTGLKELGATRFGNSSVIIAHTKQQMDVVPTGNGTSPRLLHTTGSITVGTYQKNRVGALAEQTHTLGGLVVEISTGQFFVSQVQAMEDGSFCWFDKKYRADGKVEKNRAEAFEMGDLHVGWEDEAALNAWYEVFDRVKPRRVFVQDFFDGTSISHHMAHNVTARAMRPENLRTLESELLAVAFRLQEIQSRLPKDSELILKYGNHEDFLPRYLNSGRYIEDHVNLKLALELHRKMLDGHNPLQYVLDPDNQYTWLDRDSDVRVEGVQMAAHGDMGPNGSKGSPQGLSQAYGRAFVGHSHTPKIFKEVWVVGTTSKLKMPYTSGASSWLHCSGILHKGGGRQLVIAIGGKWRP